MNILSLVKSSYGSMRANKLRTALTVLGVSVGIASIMIAFSAGKGIESLVVGSIQSFGSDFIDVEVKVPSNKSKQTTSSEAQSGSSQAQGVQITTLTLEDMEEINKVPNIVDSYSAVLGQEKVSFQNESKTTILYGVNSSYIDIDPSEVEAGRFYTDAEDRSQAQVAVLGYKIKETLFGDNEAVGKFINIGGGKYRVIGVMEERGAVMMMDFDNYVYIPIRTLQKRLMGIDHVLYMISKVENMDKAEETASEIRVLLRENHDIEFPDDPDDIGRDDFRVVTMTEMMGIMETITWALTLLLLAIVTISLVVGGVGIMNIMYVIVSERTPEIGLRKAVGAKFSDIMYQFLIESTFITLIGGICGIALGIAGAYLVAFFAKDAGWEFSVPYYSYIVAVVFSIVFGILFGLFPAQKAARLDPIQALRNE